MVRKIYSGTKNDKERKKKQLIDATGAVLRREGYPSLTASKIAKEAGLSRRLIDAHFGSLDQLLDAYVRSKDYWTRPAIASTKIPNAPKEEPSKLLLEQLLINQLDYFSSEEEMQQIILWQLSQRSQVMFDIAEEREQFGHAFFEQSDKVFNGTDVDLRAIAGLLVGGVYYMVLHAKKNDSLFCGIDVNSIEGMDRMKKAIGNILADAYSHIGFCKNK